MTIVSHGLFYRLINQYALNKIVPATLLSPVLAVLMAVPLLGEPITMPLVIGGLLTMAGVVLVQFCRQPTPEPVER